MCSRSLYWRLRWDIKKKSQCLSTARAARPDGAVRKFCSVSCMFEKVDKPPGVTFLCTSAHYTWESKADAAGRMQKCLMSKCARCWADFLLLSSASNGSGNGTRCSNPDGNDAGRNNNMNNIAGWIALSVWCWPHQRLRPNYYHHLTVLLAVGNRTEPQHKLRWMAKGENARFYRYWQRSHHVIVRWWNGL